MAIEAATYVAQLDKTLPQGTSSPTEGDDHLRKIKETLTNTFPNALGVVSATHADLSAVAGGAGSGASLNVAAQIAGTYSAKAASTAFVGDAVAAASVANSGPLVMLTLYAEGIL